MSIAHRIADSEILEQSRRFDAAAIMVLITADATSYRRRPTESPFARFEKLIQDEIIVLQSGASDSLDWFTLKSLPHKETRHSQDDWAPSKLRSADGTTLDTVKLSKKSIPKVLYDAFRSMVLHTGSFHGDFRILPPDAAPEPDIQHTELGVEVLLTSNTYDAFQGLSWRRIVQLREMVRFAPENHNDFAEAASRPADEIRRKLFPREAPELSAKIDAYLLARDQKLRQFAAKQAPF